MNANERARLRALRQAASGIAFHRMMWGVRVGAERWWPLSDDGRPCAWPVVPAAKEGE